MSARRTNRVRPACSLYTPSEIAGALGCSEWWVKEQARRRRIPFSWIGGSYRFTDEHLAEIIRAFEYRPERGGAPPVEETATTPRRPRIPRQPQTGAQLRARTPPRARRNDTSHDEP